MDPFYFDYEFIFEDQFEQDVYNEYPIPDLDNTLLYIVQDVASRLQEILRVQPGIHAISSFGVHDDQRLKITIINTLWQPAP